MTIRNFSILMAATVALGGCAMIQKLTCNSGSARSSAERDVLAGNLSKPSLSSGDSCEGEYTREQYRADYDAAFTAKKKEICTTTAAESAGMSDAQAGKMNKPSKTQLGACADMGSHHNLEMAYDNSFRRGTCTSIRAAKVAEDQATAGVTANFDEAFGICSAAEKAAMKTTFDSAYSKKAFAMKKAKEEEFVRTTGTTSFTYATRAHTAVCTVAQDRSHVQVVVDNPYPEQVLLQGQWQYTYYDANFRQLLEDTAPEAVLLSRGNKKAFQKLTLPRDAAYCRAAYLGETIIR